MNDSVTLPNKPLVPSGQMQAALIQRDLGDMPVSVAIYFDDRLYERVESMAQKMAKSSVVVPQHLREKPDVCFAVIVYALSWKLNPYAVGAATYQPVEGGRIGFEGKLIQAIIENAGRLEPGTGGVHFSHYGDWSKVQGKFEIATSNSGKKYAKATWTDDDARAGRCGVKVWAHMRGEKEARSINFDLIQAQPRNSTLWAVDPRTQIQYTAVRRFGNTACPGLLMGVPFDVEDNAHPIEREVPGEVVGVEMPTSRAEESQKSEATAAQTANNAAKSESQTRAGEPTASDQIDKSTEVTKSEAPMSREAALPEARNDQAASDPGPLITGPQARVVAVKMKNGGVTDKELVERFGFNSAQIPMSQINAVMAWMDNPAGQRGEDPQR